MTLNDISKVLAVFAVLLTLALLVLKLAGFIDPPWIVVFTPVMVLAVYFLGVFAFLAWALTKQWWDR